MARPTFTAQLFFKVLRHTRFGSVEFTLPNGKQEIIGEGPLVTRVFMHSWIAFDVIMRRGDLGLAEAIIQGYMTVEDEPALIEWACRNEAAMAQTFHGTWLGTLAYQIRRLFTSGNRTAAKKNIMAHYDLGNEFYKLWLDPSMTYSSALFREKNQNLTTAQYAKYDRMIEQLNIKSGDQILEVGCGWGGFFSRAVEKTGCHVTAVLNSEQQAEHNRQMIASRKMNSHVNLLNIDYRDISGKFDKIISIEMIEAVGEKHWPSYFGKLAASLKDRGTAMVQSITMHEDFFENYRRSTDFIQQYIFPGGMLLTNTVFREQGDKAGMLVTDIFEFPQSYAATLKTWRENFVQARAEILALGFDEKFIRMWNLYLSYCEGAFRAGRVSVGQFQLERV